MTTFFDVLASHYADRRPIVPMCKGLDLADGARRVLKPGGSCDKIETSTGDELCAFFKNPGAQWVCGRCQMATHFVV